jgi:hypothetical protein
MNVARWQEIEGFDGLYEVSDEGRVRSMARSHKLQSGSRTLASRMKTLTRDKDGYFMVQLWKESKPYPRKVHRLVAAAFLAKPENATDVNHKDADKGNNNLVNLEWCTHRANGEHAARTSIMAFGSGHGIAKLTEADIPVIRSLLAERVPMAKIAEKFLVSSSTIFDIAHGKTWVRA